MFIRGWHGRVGVALAAAFLGEGLAARPVTAEPAQSSYHVITSTQSQRVITLTGRDLTIDQVIAVARDGAQVRLSAEARQRQEDNYGLLLEAQLEGVPIYRFNRAGSF